MGVPYTSQVQGHYDRLWRDGEQSSTLVFIGANLRADELRRGFDACASAAATPPCLPCDDNPPRIGAWQAGEGLRQRLQAGSSS